MFDKAGQLIYKNPNMTCDYRSDGSVIAANSNLGIVRLLNNKDEVLWTRNKVAHHNLMFTPDENRILMITDDAVKLNSVLYRTDCFEIYNLSGQMLRRWCVKDHLEELRKLGLDPGSAEVSLWLNRIGPEPKVELSHANSFYEIPDNDRGAHDPAFKKGNYILNLYGAAKLVLILDENLEKILWAKNLNNFKKDGVNYAIFSHDIQVTQSGDILLYANSMVLSSTLGLTSLHNLFRINLGSGNSVRTGSALNQNRNLNLSSSLMTFDPYTEQIKWDYHSTPQSLFSSSQFGSVTEMPGRHYLFNNNTNKVGEAFEIDSSGKIYWHYLLENPKNKDSYFLSIRPLMKLSFLKNRGLIQ
ncbi:MAG: hypothetical protein ACXWQQ_00455 [Pseudobdellovibrio sp.]